MSASNDSWFVKTKFGAELGPMPRDALTELVRTSALLAGDLVRQELTDEWTLASEVSGLFESVTPISVDVSQEIENWIRPRTGVSLTSPEPVVLPSPPALFAPVPRIRFSASDGVSSRSREEPETSQPTALTTDSTVEPATQTSEPTVRPTASTLVSDEANLPAETPTAETPAIQSDDLISLWKSARGPTRKQAAMKSLAEDVERDLDEDSVPPVIPSIEFDQPVFNLDDEADESPKFTEPLNKEAPAQRHPSFQRPSLMSLIEPREDIESAFNLEMKGAQETWTQKWQRWIRSLPSKPILAGALVVVVATWWFWPHSQRVLYNRLLTMWTDLNEKRTHFKGQQDWDAFVSRSKSELDEVVPWLEKHAHENREKTLLLYVSRDCLKPILDKPRQTDTNSEKRLRLFFDSLQRFYDPSQAPPLPSLLDHRSPSAPE